MKNLIHLVSPTIIVKVVFSCCVLFQGNSDVDSGITATNNSYWSIFFWLSPSSLLVSKTIVADLSVMKRSVVDVVLGYEGNTDTQLLHVKNSFWQNMKEG